MAAFNIITSFAWQWLSTPWFDGQRDIRGARQGQRRISQFRLARRGPRDEPEQGKGNLQLEDGAALLGRTRRETNFRRLG